ncbi:MAG: carbon storage regulator [Planctomycetes bacterium]|nr:carbon storage regulator [Planctomycetota bacterium]MBM4058619.1 carbon storage regulator [Planctomycetota bacterium]
MLVLTRKNRESVVIGRPGELEIALEITVLEIEGGRVRLGFEADNKLPIHRREVWDRICNGSGNLGRTGRPTATGSPCRAARSWPVPRGWSQEPSTASPWPPRWHGWRFDARPAAQPDPGREP